MHLSEYQTEAATTDQAPEESDIKSIMIPLLGLAGEAGSLLTEYKKYLRDGDAYKIFHDRISEELGDILWYVSNIATKAGLNLDDIAQKNLSKVADRWNEVSSPEPVLFDENSCPEERFPRKFEITVSTVNDVDGKQRVQLYYNGSALGNPLRDNTYEEDGYRLHDVFHLSYLSVLGWSPVMRKFLGCKRRSLKEIDENEDGGRAQVIDEAISAFVFSEAKKHSYFEGINSIDYSVIRMIKELTSHLEVRRCSAKQWEEAILTGFKVWRALRAQGHGVIRCDLLARTMDFTFA